MWFKLQKSYLAISFRVIWLCEPTCNILAQCLLAVHVVAVRTVIAVLLNEALHPILEVVDRRVFPPLMQIAVPWIDCKEINS